MLPSYSSAEQEKMQRHGYPAAANGNSFRLGSRTPGTFITPAKFSPKSPTFRRRKQLLSRLGLATAVTCILLFLFPSLRPLFLAPLSLFLPSEDFHLETVRYYDLTTTQGTSKGWERGERVLLCAPLRDASPHLPMFFSHLNNLTYPHNLIDLAFLVGDSKDNTITLLSDMLANIQDHEDPRMRFGEISIIEKDFGQSVKQDVESRHGFAAQASRRKSMAQARNWLLSAALRPSHSWVYWRDVDVETAPTTILEDLMRHNKDVIVPNVWRPLPDWLGGEQPYDLNSWQESDTALALADTLDEDAVIVEGYAEYATWRPHLAYLRDPFGDPDMEMEIDGVGGVSILAKAKVFRSGVHFPAFSFEKHAETEGFGKMAKRMDYSVVGLPHYTIWHLYEPSADDIRHMEEMEKDKKKKEAEEALKLETESRLKTEFASPAEQWSEDVDAMKKKEGETAQQVEAARKADAARKEAAAQKERESAVQEQAAKQGGQDTANHVSDEDIAAGEEAVQRAKKAAKLQEGGEEATKPSVDVDDKEAKEKAYEELKAKKEMEVKAGLQAEGIKKIYGPDGKARAPDAEISEAKPIEAKPAGAQAVAAKPAVGDPAVPVAAAAAAVKAAGGDPAAAANPADAKAQEVKPAAKEAPQAPAPAPAQPPPKKQQAPKPQLRKPPAPAQPFINGEAPARRMDV